MKLFIFLLVFFGSVAIRGAGLASSLFLAMLAVIVVSLVLRAVKRQAKSMPRPGRKREPEIADGDIGPFVAYQLERGDREAVVNCLVQHIPAGWSARVGMLNLAEEHCRLQQSIRIATMANVPMPDDIAAFSKEQTDLIADRARRMAFVYQHGLMNPRIQASLARLTQGAGELTSRSVALRAELAESTSSPQWSEMEERELRRKLERMSNTLRAMSSDVLTNDFERLSSPAPKLPSTKTGS